MQEGQNTNPAPEPKPCRHEYVRIFQRRLKGLDRRLVSTRAYLPTGFKIGDFGHLSEGSFAFALPAEAGSFPSVLKLISCKPGFWPAKAKRHYLMKARTCLMKLGQIV